MEYHYTWKTKLFSRNFDIYTYETLTGTLKKEGWSRKTLGEMKGRKILFETKGFIKHETIIVNQTENTQIGSIRFNFWRSRSQINYNNREYSWQFDNFWRTRWSLSNENGYLVRYHSRGFKGTIDAYTEDVILILTGFFIRNYYKQRSSEAAAASA
jgi:hypothetical protein